MSTSKSGYTLGIQFPHLLVLVPAAGDAHLLRVAEKGALVGADGGELRFLRLVESLVHAAYALHYDSGLYLRSLDRPRGSESPRTQDRAVDFRCIEPEPARFLQIRAVFLRESRNGFELDGMADAGAADLPQQHRPARRDLLLHLSVDELCHRSLSGGCAASTEFY